MAPRVWNHVALEASLAELRDYAPGLLDGRHGRLVGALQRRGELRVMWLAFEEYEDLPYGAWRANRLTILAFLEWARANPRFPAMAPAATSPCLARNSTLGRTR